MSTVDLTQVDMKMDTTKDKRDRQNYLPQHSRRLITLLTRLVLCHSQCSIRHRLLVFSFLLCCHFYLPQVQLYLKPTVYIYFSRSFFQVFLGCHLPLWPCGVHCSACLDSWKSVFNLNAHMDILKCLFHSQTALSLLPLKDGLQRLWKTKRVYAHSSIVGHTGISEKDGLSQIDPCLHIDPWYRIS